jgi:hypothetical protein
MIGSYYVSLSLFIIYIGIILYKIGIPKSISESSYLWGKNGNIYFYGWIIAVIFPMLMYWLQITEGTPYQFMVFLSCAGLMGAGVTGRYRDYKSESIIHTTSTVICAIMASLWALLTFSYWWIVCLIVFPVFLLTGKLIKGHQRNIEKNIIELKTDSVVFFVEMACFILTFIAIYLY